MTRSLIEWTNETWNPVRGCSRISAGCQNCYAERQAHRFNGLGKPYEGLTTLRNGRPGWTGEVRFVPEMLDMPLRWRKPRMVFVNSMSDLFHERVSDEQIAAVFGVMAACPQHTFQVLTKRPLRTREWFAWIDERAEEVKLKYPNEEREGRYAEALISAGLGVHGVVDMPNKIPQAWPLPNLWLGVSCENQAAADERIPLLLQTPAEVRWVSCEPLLGPIDLERVRWPEKHRVDVLRGGTWELPRCRLPGFVNHSDMETLDWVVVGGESGPGARPCDVSWIRSIVQQCRSASVPAFVKQLGSNPRPQVVVCGRPTYRNRKGGDPSEWPEDIRVREFPKVSQ